MTALVASSLPSSDASAHSSGADDYLDIDITIVLPAIDEAPPTLRSVLDDTKERETLPVVCTWADAPREPPSSVTDAHDRETIERSGKRCKQK